MFSDLCWLCFQPKHLHGLPHLSAKGTLLLLPLIRSSSCSQLLVCSGPSSPRAECMETAVSLLTPWPLHLLSVTKALMLVPTGHSCFSACTHGFPHSVLWEKTSSGWTEFRKQRCGHWGVCQAAGNYRDFPPSSSEKFLCTGSDLTLAFQTPSGRSSHSLRLTFRFFFGCSPVNIRWLPKPLGLDTLWLTIRPSYHLWPKLNLLTAFAPLRSICCLWSYLWSLRYAHSITPFIQEYIPLCKKIHSLKILQINKSNSKC